MPFQDVEDEPVEVPKPPGTIERWVRKLFVEDIGLKLLALAITLFVWTAVTSENQPMTIHTAVPLNFVQPDNLSISNDPPRTVEVLLTGSRNKLNNLRWLDLVATVDLTDSKPGERVIHLSPERVSIQLPSGVTITSFEPTTLPIRLEPIVRREVPVDVRLDGNPADGFEVYGTQATPAAVWVSGPATHVGELHRAPTETVSIEGRKESFTIARVSLAIPDQKLKVHESPIDVAVTIGEKRVEKVLENISLRWTDNSSQPRVAKVTLLGPRHIVEQLNGNNTSVMIDRSPTGDSIPQLQVPSGLETQIKLVSINPHLDR
jgi:YbbR domain-containing protein